MFNLGLFNIFYGMINLNVDLRITQAGGDFRKPLSNLPHKAGQLGGHTRLLPV